MGNSTRGYNKEGKCVKCKQIIKAECPNCGSENLKRYVNWDIKEEWFHCKNCTMDHHWMPCPNCFTQNPLDIFGRDQKGCFWIIVIIIIIWIFSQIK